MVKIFRTIDNNVHQINEAQEGSWIALINPTATEIVEIAEKYNIDVDHLRHLCGGWNVRVSKLEDHYTLILVDIPMIEERNDKEWYGTIPMGIVVTDE